MTTPNLVIDEKPKVKEPGFQSVAEVLKRQIGAFGRGKFAHTASIQQSWRKAVGPSVAKHSQVLFLKEGILHVGVESSTWLNELHLIRTQILNQIKKAVPDIALSDIKIKIVSKN